jgi:hypothetical protein
LGKPSNIFGKVFGASSLEIAIKLLHRALKKEKDIDIRKELTKRLRAPKTYSDSQIIVAN